MRAKHETLRHDIVLVTGPWGYQSPSARPPMSSWMWPSGAVWPWRLSLPQDRQVIPTN